MTILEQFRAKLHGLSFEEMHPRERERLLRSIGESFGFELTPAEATELLSIVEQEYRPFGVLQSLIDEPSISDIIVHDYAKVAIQIGRKNFPTDIRFPSQTSYEAFVEKLLIKAGTTYSTKQPIADGMIGGLVRIHAVHRSLCAGGPYLTIRVNRFDTISLSMLADAELAPPAIIEYFKIFGQQGRTILLVGEVGTGKTTLARAIAGSIPAHDSVLVIEDTPEIRIEHPHVRYLSTREENAEGVGKIAPSACIRAGMRMAMNRIILGEIRDAEAAESFIDVCASGHPGLSTVHGRSAQEGIARLELFLGRAQPGVSRHTIHEQIAGAVHSVVHLGVCPISGKRRVFEVRELGAAADGTIRHRTIFQYKPGQVGEWKVANKVSYHRDILEPELVLSSLPDTLQLSRTKSSDGERRVA
jgi:pilus assembly protein CpaF